MTHGSLFSGIGGFEIAAQWMGWDNIFHCEWNEFGQKVLKHHFPKSISYEDITKTDFSIHRGTIDILTGGFPCQPYSTAGKRLGKEDERHLWPEMLRAIREIEPRWVVGENVRGLVSWSGGLVFEEVCTDLEAQGYNIQPFLLPAASVNAPHRRDRIWFVAFKDTNNNGWRSFEWQEESSIGQQRNSCTGDNERLRTDNDKIRSITNTNNDRTGYGLGQIQSENGKVSEWNNDAEPCNADKFNDVTNSDGERSRKLTSEDKGWEDRRFDNNGENEYVTDSKLIRLEHSTDTREVLSKKGKEYEGKWNKPALPTKANGNGYKSDWENFPTVSPICNGDDGLSDRLDAITFPKWRNESIKAGGNAIVPQVAHQIFKAIQEYEQHYGSRLQ